MADRVVHAAVHSGAVPGTGAAVPHPQITATILKSMGVKAGVPDLHLPVPSGQYHSLYIEMKARDGKPQPEQLWWADHLKANGNAHAICYGWEQAREVLLWYLNLKQ